MATSKKLGILHTSFVLVDMLTGLVRQRMPDVTIINIVDDSLVGYAIRNGVDELLRKRIKSYLHSAVDAGADAILSGCSSVGEAIDAARPEISVPILKIDEAMAEKAVTLGQRIGIFATASSTLGPTARLLKAKAQAIGRMIETGEEYCEGGFELMLNGRIADHDQLVTNRLMSAKSKYDVLILAQASMSRLAATIADRIDRPLLTSPELAIERMAKLLD